MVPPYTYLQMGSPWLALVQKHQLGMVVVAVGREDIVMKTIILTQVDTVSPSLILCRMFADLGR